jgi:predicted DNA-binding transcriptional regulator AlpA
MPERLLSYNDLRTHGILPLAAQTLRRYVSEGRLPHVKIGSRVFFKENEIRSWVDEHAVPAGGGR